MMSLTIAGTAVLNSLVADLSPELAAMLFCCHWRIHPDWWTWGHLLCLIFQHSSHIVLILMLVIEVFYNPFNNPENPFGDSESVFDFISCWKTPDEDMGNKGGSYLTFFSS